MCQFSTLPGFIKPNGSSACLMLAIKFNSQGQILWSRQMGEPSIATNFMGIEILSGDTLAMGGQVDTFFTKGIGINSMYQLCKIAPNGDSLWCTYIDIVKDSTNEDVFNSFASCSDGGFVLTGNSSGGPNPKPFTLVKVDKQGCVQAGCNATATQELSINEKLTLYPNPTTNTLNVYAPQATQLFIYNLLGSIIQTIYTTTETTTLNTSNLPNGVYFIKTNTGQVGKFVKE